MEKEITIEELISLINELDGEYINHVEPAKERDINEKKSVPS